MTESEINRKFSISLIKAPRTSLVQIDPQYEFDAPQYFDFSTETSPTFEE